MTPRDEIEDINPLSPLQQGILFHVLADEESEAYFDQIVYELRGLVDAAALEAAFQRAVRRHPVLRTTFAWKGTPQPLQVVRRRARLSFELVDWRDVPPAEQARRLDALLAADRRRRFSIDRAPLMRVTLIHRGKEGSTLVWSRHHLVLDGWSVALVLGEVVAAYAALVEGREPPEGTPPRPFRDYIAWLAGQNLSSAESYFRALLAGVTAPTPIGGTAPPEAGPGSVPRSTRFWSPADGVTAMPMPIGPRSAPLGRDTAERGRRRGRWRRECPGVRRPGASGTDGFPRRYPIIDPFSRRTQDVVSCRTANLYV